jgi:polar amino acid transport system substrate-binding protein
MAYSRQTDDDTVLRTQAAFEHLQAEGEVARIMAGQP